MRRFTTSWSYGVTAWKTSRCRDSCGCDFGSKHGTRSVQRDWLGIIARHPPVCVRGRVCARAQNKCNSFSRFVFVLAENRKAGGVREEVEGGTGALNGAACGVRLYILFYFILLKKRKENNNKNANTLISGRILCHGSSKPLKGVSARPHVLLLPDPSSV